MHAPEPLLAVRSLTKSFAGPRGRSVALRDLSFNILPGRSLAVVGESGSGKTTAALCITRLLVPDSGSVTLAGDDFTAAPPRQLRQLRRRLGLVLQDPLSSLDPRMRVWQSVAEPLRVHEAALSRRATRQRAMQMLDRVGLNPAQGESLPHQLSGGQLQRAVIARALILQPALLVLDEPTSALDVSVQAQILNLLCDLRDELDLSLLFITHNLPLVEIIAHDVLVMFAGAVVERGPVAEVFARPRHPYTAALLAAIPQARAGATATLGLAGIAASAAGQADASADAAPLAPAALSPSVCAYSTRCPHVHDRCLSQRPSVATADQPVACFLAMPQAVCTP